MLESTKPRMFSGQDQQGVTHAIEEVVRDETYRSETEMFSLDNSLSMIATPREALNRVKEHLAIKETEKMVLQVKSLKVADVNGQLHYQVSQRVTRGAEQRHFYVAVADGRVSEKAEGGFYDSF